MNSPKWIEIPIFSRSEILAAMYEIQKEKEEAAQAILLKQAAGNVKIENPDSSESVPGEEGQGQNRCQGQEGNIKIEDASGKEENENLDKICVDLKPIFEELPDLQLSYQDSQPEPESQFLKASPHPQPSTLAASNTSPSAPLETFETIDQNPLIFSCLTTTGRFSFNNLSPLPGLTLSSSILHQSSEENRKEQVPPLKQRKSTLIFRDWNNSNSQSSDFGTLLNLDPENKIKKEPLLDPSLPSIDKVSFESFNISKIIKEEKGKKEKFEDQVPYGLKLFKWEIDPEELNKARTVTESGQIVYSEEFILTYGLQRLHSDYEVYCPRPFICPVPECGKGYKNSNGMKYHAQNGHKDKQNGDVPPPTLDKSNILIKVKKVNRRTSAGRKRKYLDMIKAADIIEDLHDTTTTSSVNTDIGDSRDGDCWTQNETGQGQGWTQKETVQGQGQGFTQNETDQEWTQNGQSWTQNESDEKGQ